MNINIDFDKAKYTDEQLLDALELMGIKTQDRDALDVRIDAIRTIVNMTTEARTNAALRRIMEMLNSVIMRIDDEVATVWSETVYFEEIFGYTEYEDSDELEEFLDNFCIGGGAPVG